MFDFDWLALFFEGLVPGWGVALAGLAIVVGTAMVIGVIRAAWRAFFG